jgi:uncharacterized protein (TIGR03437 family)
LNVVAPAEGKSARRSATACSLPGLEILFRSLRANFVAIIGKGTTVDVQVADHCGNLLGAGSGTSVTASFSNGDGGIQLTPVGNGVWSGTWRPIKLTQAPVSILVTAFHFQGGTVQANQVLLTGAVSAGITPPIVTAGGVVHAAGFATGGLVAPGTLITIKGDHLADGTTTSQILPLPFLQDGTQVFLGDKPMPLLYTSDGQLNVQVPFDVPVSGQYQVTVQRDAVASVPESLVMSMAQPGIFTANENGTGQGDIFKSDRVTLAQPGTPAAAGESIIIFCSGLGAVTPSVAAGQPAPDSPQAQTVNPVAVQIGGQAAKVEFSGLTAGAVGLYEVRAVVPDGVAPGDEVQVTIEIAGQVSPAVTMAVQ